MDQSSLQHFLNKEVIPKIKKRPKTFLGIAKQPHYENVLSNIYAFFFNVNEEHGFNDLFIKSLISCIDVSEIKGKNFSSFTDFDIETEYGTKGIGSSKRKGRIDLLLYNNEQAIIIENKVYHHLNNDLDDYWKSVKLNTESTESKIGIILSLKPISEDQYSEFDNKDEYINITHAQLMVKVMANATCYFEDTSERLEKYRFYLRDFNQNILNISTPTMDEKDIGFFTENKEKINQLVRFKYQFKQHVISEVEKAGGELINVKPEAPRHKSNSGRLRYYRSTIHSDLVYTIVFGGLFDSDDDRDDGLHIIVEPRGTSLRNGAIFKDLDFNEDEKKVLQPDFYKKTNKGWAHFASKWYSPNDEEVADLSSFILKKIKDDSFAIIIAKMETFLNGIKSN